jgi:alpha-L-fucosidase 2
MLLQSHTGEIHLLPALPDVWAAGTVRGLCARGGFEVNIEWRGGQLTVAEIRSKAGQPCVVRYGDQTIQLKTEPGATFRLDRNLRALQT